jgi:hypothetical protein
MPIEGELVLLREERPEDMKPLMEMRNDLETQAWSKTLPPDYTEAMLLKRFQARFLSIETTGALSSNRKKRTNLPGQ